MTPVNLKQNQDNSISDYMDGPYLLQIINQLKQLVLIQEIKFIIIFIDQIQ